MSVLHKVIVRTSGGYFEFVVLRDRFRARRVVGELIRRGIHAEICSLSEDETLEFERFAGDGGGLLMQLIEAAGLRTTTHPVWESAA